MTEPTEGSAIALRGLDHVVVVVRDITTTIADYSRVFGPPSLVEGGESVGYHRAVFDVGGASQRIELCQPLSPDEPGGDGQASRAFRQRLERLGEGVHNVAVRVDSAPEAHSELGRRQIPMIDSQHSETFFIHPRAMAGALIQFME